MPKNEFGTLIDDLQDSPDMVADMHKVFIHWLNETVDHLKRDNAVWEGLVNLGYYPMMTKKAKANGTPVNLSV